MYRQYRAKVLEVKKPTPLLEKANKCSGKRSTEWTYEGKLLESEKLLRKCGRETHLLRLLWTMRVEHGKESCLWLACVEITSNAGLKPPALNILGLFTTDSCYEKSPFRKGIQENGGDSL